MSNTAVKRFFSNRTKKINRSKAGNLAVFIVLLVLAIFSFLPLLLTFTQAFKPLNELFIYPPKLLPQNPTLQNFALLFDLMGSSWVPFSRYIFNTVFVSVIGTVGHIILASMCAYPLAKLNLKGGTIIFSLIVTSLMFPAAVNDIVNYNTISSFGLIDNYLSILLPAFASSLGLYIMKQFMSQLPDSLIEAAEIDGAGHFRVFWTIIMPNVKSAWLTLAIFSFKDLWGGANATYIYSEEMKSLTSALNQILTGGVSRAGAGAAGSVLLLIVPCVMFIITQSRIVETMATSGMKE